MDSLKKAIENADDEVVKKALNEVLKKLGYGSIQIISLKIVHADKHAHNTPCLPPKERVCYWDLNTGKRICKCV